MERVTTKEPTFARARVCVCVCVCISFFMTHHNAAAAPSNTPYGTAPRL